MLNQPPLDSAVSWDAGIEPRTAETSALAVRRYNHSVRSHPQTHYIPTFLLPTLATFCTAVHTYCRYAKCGTRGLCSSTVHFLYSRTYIFYLWCGTRGADRDTDPSSCFLYSRTYVFVKVTGYLDPVAS